MIWEWYVLIGLAILGISVTWAGLGIDGMWPGPLVLVNGITWVCAFVFLMPALIGTIGASVDKNKCYKFGRQTGFQVKFIRYNTLFWDCLVNANGRWISQDNLQNVVINKDK